MTPIPTSVVRILLDISTAGTSGQASISLRPASLSWAASDHDGEGLELARV